MLKKRCFLLLLLIFIVISTLLSGCATGRSKYPRMSGLSEKLKINGKDYVSVPYLAKHYYMRWEWDILTREVKIIKDNVEVKFIAGSPIVLVNGTPSNLRYPALVYRGDFVIPVSFVEYFLASYVLEPYIKQRAIKGKSTPKNTIRRVVVDAGHGGKDTGAIGSGGLLEKDVVLDIAKRLKQSLSNSGMDVVMTRERDVFISLPERVRIANTSNADLFISVHANATTKNWVKGIEAFYLSEAFDDESKAVKCAQETSLSFNSLAGRKADVNLKATVWDLVLTQNRKESLKLTRYICEKLGAELCVRDRGSKPERFYVLKHTNIPSVLIEVGFITNRGEAYNLSSSGYRAKVAESIKNAVMEYKKEFELTNGFGKSTYY